MYKEDAQMSVLTDFFKVKGHAEEVNLWVVLCCVFVGVLWIAMFLLVSPVEGMRLGLTAQSIGTASLIVRLIAYSFVHTDATILLLNCSVLACQAVLLAKCCSVLDFFRLISLGGIFGGIIYLAASWVLRNDAHLCGGHTALMACCTALLVLDPGAAVGQSARGRTLLVSIYFFFGGWLSGRDNLSASLVAMLAGLSSGLAYGLISQAIRRGWQVGRQAL